MKLKAFAAALIAAVTLTGCYAHGDYYAENDFPVYTEGTRDQTFDQIDSDN